MIILKDSRRNLAISEQFSRVLELIFLLSFTPWTLFFLKCSNKRCKHQQLCSNAKLYWTYSP